MFMCMDCLETWTPTFKLADGSPCDDTHCRLCMGTECPDCGSNHTTAIVSMAQVRRIKSLKSKEKESEPSNEKD
jgi:hypothetical protein